MPEPKPLTPSEWGALRAKVARWAAKSTIGLGTDGEDIAAEAITKALHRAKREDVSNFGALVWKIARNLVTSIKRQTARDRAAKAAGRPRIERHGSVAALRLATLEACATEFKQTWAADAGEVLPGDLAEMSEKPERDRRGWLAFALDHGLGDYCPWAVHASFRVQGAWRRGLVQNGELRPGRGLTAMVPQRVNWAARLWSLWCEIKQDPQGLERLMRLIRSEADIPALVQVLAGKAGRPERAERGLGSLEYLTDREMAVVSLLLGNWPASIAAGATGDRLPKEKTWGQVMSAEVDAMQVARARHGLFKTAAEKRGAFVGPKARRR